MVRIYYLIVLFIAPNFSFSQQCGYYHYYLFAVNVHGKNSNEKIPNLKMYLTEENGKACTAEVLFQEKNKWNRRNDTLFFWDNKSISKNDGTVPLVRRKFYNIGDCYVVVFRMDRAALKDPLKYPLYKLKIEAGENELNGNAYPEQYVNLPLNKSIWLCNNGILEKFRPVKPVETIEGKEFKIIDITLNEYEQAGVAEVNSTQNLKYILRPEFEKHTNPVAYNREEFKVKSVNIYAATTGKLEQQIDIRSNVIGFSETKYLLLETGDYYHRQIKVAKDFAVAIEAWRDTVFSVERKKTNFYLFDPEDKKYYLDSLLSKETDVYYYSPLKTMRRLEYKITDTSKLINTYQLENKKWKLIDKREELFPAFKPKQKYQSAACITVNEKYHRLPIITAIGTNAKAIVKDSFLLYNNCEDAIKIISINSQTQDFFSISKTLLPRQYTKLSFEGTINNSSIDFGINSYSCYLTLEDNTVLALSIDIPTISNNSKVVYRNDATVDYMIIPRKDSRYSKVILTYPDGNIRAMGMAQDGDTSLKAGKWQFFEKGDWRMHEYVYSKEITMSALNQKLNFGNAAFKIRVFENGLWKEKEQGTRTIYVTEATDSIVAFNDSLAYGFRLPYKEISENNQVQFYLLKPGERTLKIGFYETPFKTINDNYSIILDYAKVKDRFKTTYQITDSIINSLQKQYPQIAIVHISRNMKGISLERMKGDEKNALLAQLAEDRNISFISQLFTITDKEALTYCNNRVYVDLKGRDPELLKQAAFKIGFTDMQVEMGNNRYWLTYKSKMIDERFFEAYHELTKLPWVLSAYLNTYHEPELETKSIETNH